MAPFYPACRNLSIWRPGCCNFATIWYTDKICKFNCQL
nr:MAG TPA: hypothetical protein [Caudoviricetes sp.]